MNDKTKIMELSIKEIHLLLSLIECTSDICDTDYFEEIKALFNKLEQQLKNNNETLEDLISSIEGVESIVYNSEFGTTFIYANRCSLSDKELQRLWNYADNNKNIVIYFK